MRALRILLGQRDYVGAGVDDEADRLAIDVGDGEEMPAATAIKHRLGRCVLHRSSRRGRRRSGLHAGQGETDRNPGDGDKGERDSHPRDFIRTPFERR